MAAKKVFSDKELQQMVDDLAQPKATKTAVARKWGIAATTLTRKIDDFKNKQEKAEERKQAKKHTRMTQDEIDTCVEYYVQENWSMNKIAELIQRSAGAVKRALENANVPIRARGKKAQTVISGDTENPLKVGDTVYSFKYNAYAVVMSLFGVDGDTFRIWVTSDSSQFSAYQSRESLALLP